MNVKLNNASEYPGIINQTHPRRQRTDLESRHPQAPRLCTWTIYNKPPYQGHQSIPRRHRAEQTVFAISQLKAETPAAVSFTAALICSKKAHL